jgi:hypothetical protein
MSALNENNHRRVARSAHWGWLLPILALAPLSLAAKGCSNDGVVGDDCPTAADCMNGTAGTTGTAGSNSQAGTGNSSSKSCGGLLGLQCGKDEFCSFPEDAMCGAADQTGTCQPRPNACDDIYSPVCGCDGKTYANECEANGAGQSASSKGECGDPNPGDGTCGGLLPKDCEQGEYCNFAPETTCGSGDQTGKCEAIPGACDLVYAPVCGCDGMTYGNSCAAAMAGVSVAAQGECNSDPGDGTCGGKTGAMCGASQYCNYPPEASCGRFDATGKCTDIPEGRACITLYDPVCGCDGKTYGNSCEANLAGASIDHDGACNAAGTICGGFIGVQCDAGQYCDYPPEMACGNADGSGVCRDIPEACTAQADPVCGCDGETYGNACLAASNGVSVLSKGACK